VARDPRAPCIIGVARRTWREEPAPEPLDMWEEMARAAGADAGPGEILSQLQSIQVVYCQSWQYDDPCGRLAERLGANPAHRFYSGLGGSVPVRLISETAASMATGDGDLALLVGGEALATLRHLPEPAWSFAPEEKPPFPISINPSEAANGIFQAYLTFALLDTARRAHLGLSIADHRDKLGSLLASMSQVAAADSEHAWFPIARKPDEITTVNPSNRMVATPYTKLMTAIMDVDMAAAVLVATDERADALGIDPDKRIYLRGSGTAVEPSTMASRPELWHSPAMERAMREALGDTPGEEVGHFDLYSCFSSSLSFGRDALGLGEDRVLTVTGGLPYHGGPGSNYDTHALAAMTEKLRTDPDALGLVSGIGMHMESHSAVLLSARPGDSSPTRSDPAPAAGEAEAGSTVPVADEAKGPARVVTYSTMYSREGPDWTALICDLPDGSRTYARTRDAVGEGEDLAGQTVTLEPGKRGSTTAHR
jgi:acetyl-CoA C-acetyltransferase